jgi:hypothetical protein
MEGCNTSTAIEINPRGAIRTCRYDPVLQEHPGNQVDLQTNQVSISDFYSSENGRA